MIHLIIGRTCSGKSTLEKLMADHGMTSVVSHTTRPPRYEGEPGHVFIKPEELSQFSERITETEINGYTYFTTPENIKGKDIYVIDPIGMYRLCEAMPDEIFTVIHVLCSNQELRKARYLSRAGENADDKTIATLTAEFEARNAAEDEQFTKFETQLADEDLRSEVMPKNVKCIVTIQNDETDDDNLQHIAMQMMTRADLIKKMQPFVKDAVKQDILAENEDHRIAMYTMAQDEPEYVSVEEMAQCLIDDPEGFVALMRTLLAKDRLSLK